MPSSAASIPRRVRARQDVRASGQRSRAPDSGIGHRDGWPGVPLHQSGEGVGSLRRVWSNDEPPVAVRLGKPVQEEVRVGLEVIGVEGLAGPHRDPGRRASAPRSEQVLQVPPVVSGGSGW